MRTIEKGKLFVRALMVLAIALMLVPVTAPATVSAGADDYPDPPPTGVTILDDVNIGDTTSEAGHNVAQGDMGGDWTKVWSGCGWCATHDDSNMRLLWCDGNDCCDDTEACRKATATFDTDSTVARSLVVEHLDGAGDDAFDIYISTDGGTTYTYVGAYSDVLPADTWVWDEYVLSRSFSGPLTVNLVATGPSWGSIGTYGQVAINRIELRDVVINPQVVDIGDPASEAGHAMSGWGPVEPETHGGQWGGLGPDYRVDNCRVIWDISDDNPVAEVTLTNFNAPMAKLFLEMRHLEGIADDSFDVEVKDSTTGQYVKVGHYHDTAVDIEEPITAEDWVMTSFEIKNVMLNAGGPVEVRLTATNKKWSGFGTFGQVGFD